MAGTSRALTLKLLADVDNFTKGIKSADNDVSTFGDKIGKFGKVAGAAFAAAGAAAAAYAGKLLVDGVKSAIEDEAAQKKLALTLGNVTDATDAQIAATEDYITQTSLAYGITDDKLRPSLERLARATGDVEEAQKLQALALDVSAGSGKDLEAVTNALAKAAEGNTSALGKLGAGLTKAELKTMDMEAITAKLAKTFQGQAIQQADTFQGKMARLTIAFNEAKETVGSYVLSALQPLLDGLVNNVIPAVTDLADKLGKTLGPAFGDIFRVIQEDVVPVFRSLFDFIFNEYIPLVVKTFRPVLESIVGVFQKVRDAIARNEDKLRPLLDLFEEVWKFIKNYLAPIYGAVLSKAIETVGDGFVALIDTVAFFVDKINAAYNAVKKLIDFLKNNPVSKFLTGASFNINSSLMAAPSEVPSLSSAAGSYASYSPTTNITVNGAIDSESTARQIVSILNDSSARGTLGAAGFAV